jgi:hypothetical protein
LIAPTGTLRSLSQEKVVSLREQSPSFAEEQAIGKLPLEELMMPYFVALKQSKRLWRVAARLSYDAGFALLAIPTLAVFVSVVRSSALLLRQVLG